MVSKDASMNWVTEKWIISAARWAFAACCFAALIATLSPAPFPGNGKVGFVLHVMAYATLAGFVILGWRSPVYRFWLLLALFAAGASLEVVQILLPERTTSLKDILGNSFGLFVGGAVMHLLRARFFRV